MSRKIIAALVVALTGLALSASAADASAPALRDDAPDRHVVVPGDTLWSIAATFLKDPYRWSEVWKLNPNEVKNPHRIYPGQVIIVDKSGLNPQLRLANQIPTEKLLPQVREDGGKPISAIPRAAIEPFLTRPLILDRDGLRETARVVAFNDHKVLAGTGDSAYVVNVPSEAVDRWQIVRPGKELKDPVSKEILGYEAVVIGTARLLKRGDPAEFMVVSSEMEVRPADRLIPAARPDVLSYPLRAPVQPILATILGITGDSGNAFTGGTYQIVSLSKGSRDGIELGHVLGLYSKGVTLVDRFEGTAREIKTPEERVGLLYVFRIFDRVSYALVMDARRPVTIGDTVRNP